MRTNVFVERCMELAASFARKNPNWFKVASKEEQEFVGEILVRIVERQSKLRGDELTDEI